jgi:ABC-type lipoprotein export system ATPase subunit
MDSNHFSSGSGANEPRVQELSPNHIIAVRNLYKSFNSSGSLIEILKDVNFDLHAGETVAIVGASGIGKSTFLHILGTLDRPDSGTLRVRVKMSFFSIMKSWQNFEMNISASFSSFIICSRNSMPLKT